jgi:hypothetical protein
VHHDPAAEKRLVAGYLASRVGSPRMRTVDAVPIDTFEDRDIAANSKIPSVSDDGKAELRHEPCTLIFAHVRGATRKQKVHIPETRRPRLVDGARPPPRQDEARELGTNRPTACFRTIANRLEHFIRPPAFIHLKPREHWFEE